MANEVHLSITVTVPNGVSGLEVANALNAALDEPPCDWKDWTVGGFQVEEVGEAGEEEDTCDGCGEPLTPDSITGGRCMNCGVMVLPVYPKPNEQKGASE